MHTNTPFLKTGALCALLSAITTATLMYGPDPDMTDITNFDGLQALHSNTLHLYKRWVLFFHPQFAFLAALAAATVLAKRSAAFTYIGLFYLAVWAITEMTQQAYLIDALNQIWRPAYLSETGENKDAWRTMIMGLRGISDSQYFLLLFGFGVGSIFFGAAFLRQPKLGLPLGITNILIGVMSLAAFASYYAGAAQAGLVVQGWYGWFYGPIQVGVRVLLAFWLWRQAHTGLAEK